MKAFSSSVSRCVRTGAYALLCLCAMALAATPVLAQNGGSDVTQQLKQAYSEGMNAAKQDDYQTAYTQLERAHALAQEAEQSGAANQILSFLQKLPKRWGNAALKAKNYPEALTHFEKGQEHAPRDAYMLYGQGLALVNLDSTDTAMSVMSQSIEVGQANGDTRTANLATERIRDEYVSRASKALSANAPTQANADTALDALDAMREYVDPSAKSLFYRALALEIKGEPQQAIEVAQRGLEMHRGSRSDEAKYHFVVAESQMRLGNTQQACQTFQEAAYGDYKARSEHYLENECSN